MVSPAGNAKATDGSSHAGSEKGTLSVANVILPLLTTVWQPCRNIYYGRSKKAASATIPVLVWLALPIPSLPSILWLKGDL